MTLAIFKNANVQLEKLSVSFIEPDLFERILDILMFKPPCLYYPKHARL